MNAISIKGAAILSVHVKHKIDGSMDWASVRINDRPIGDCLAEHLSKGLKPGEDGTTQVRGLVRVHITIEPEDPLVIDIAPKSPKATEE